MTSRTLGSGYTVTVSPYTLSSGHQRWKYIVTDRYGDVVAGCRGFDSPDAADREGEIAAKRAASPLYRDPGETTKGDW